MGRKPCTALPDRGAGQCGTVSGDVSPVIGTYRNIWATGFLRRGLAPLHLTCNLPQSQTLPLLGYRDLGVYGLRFGAQMVLRCLLALQILLQRAAGLEKKPHKTKRKRAAVAFPSPSKLPPGWEWIHAVSESLLPVSQYRLQRGCTQPGGGCKRSLLRVWGEGGPGGSGGAPGAPREEAAAVPASLRRSLPPRAPLRTGTGRGSAESGPVHPGGSGPIPPPAAEEGGKGGGGAGGDAWERGAHLWPGGESCKAVRPLPPICAPIACVHAGTSPLRGHRFGTAACPISCRPLSVPLRAASPPRAMAAAALCL